MARLHPRNKVREGATLPKRWEPAFWELADQRHKLVRLVRERVEVLSEDVGADSEQKRLLVSRAAFLSIMLETLEVQASQGEPISEWLGHYVHCLNSLNGLFRALGLEKKVKPADLKSYVEKKHGRRST